MRAHAAVRLLRRARAALVRCPEDCGADDPAPVYRDASYADGQVSPDQRRIAEAMPALLRADDRLLHVGIGASDIARRYATQVSCVDGVTVVEDELVAARALGIPNYRVRLLNKHGPGLAGVGGPYTLIVDNNPWSFACCRRHARGTLATYARLLAPGGRILTDERGARWRQAGGLTLDWGRWVAEGARLGLVAERRTETVWALRRRA